MWRPLRGAVRSVEVRDLFERFIPAEERVKRLGDVIDRASILALSGDAARGRSVFATNAAAACKTCHKVADLGETVGPDLTKVGAKYNKPGLLEQILEPSKTIDPAFTAFLVETKDGRVFSGLAVEKTAAAVVLKDAQGKTVRLASAEVERMVPQSRSLDARALASGYDGSASRGFARVSGKFEVIISHRVVQTLERSCQLVSVGRHIRMISDQSSQEDHGLAEKLTGVLGLTESAGRFTEVAKHFSERERRRRILRGELETLVQKRASPLIRRDGIGQSVGVDKECTEPTICRGQAEPVVEPVRLVPDPLLTELDGLF